MPRLEDVSSSGLHRAETAAAVRSSTIELSFMVLELEVEMMGGKLERLSRFIYPLKYGIGAIQDTIFTMR